MDERVPRLRPAPVGGSGAETGECVPQPGPQLIQRRFAEQPGLLGVQRGPFDLFASPGGVRDRPCDRVKHPQVGGESEACQPGPAVAVRVRALKPRGQPDQICDAAGARHAQRPREAGPEPRPARAVEHRGQDTLQPCVPGPAQHVQSRGHIGDGGLGGGRILRGDAQRGRQGRHVGGRPRTHRPQRGVRAQRVLHDSGVHPVRIGSNVSFAHPLGHPLPELLPAEPLGGAYDVALLAHGVQPQRAQRTLVEDAPPQHLRHRNSQPPQEPDRPVPVQAAVAAVPDREPVEPTLQVSVCDRVPREEVLAAHPPAVRDLRADPSLQALHPRPRGMVRRIQRPGVQPAGIEGGVLPVEFLGDHDLAAAQPGQITGSYVVRRRPRRPREMRRTGVGHTHDPLFVTLSGPVTVGARGEQIHRIVADR